MSGAYNNASASSWINQCQTFEELQQSAVVKALRAVTGQFKASADTTVTSSTVLVQEPEFTFPVKANGRYVFQADYLFSAGATGGLKFQINAPANTTGAVFVGKSISTAAGVTAAVTLNGNSSLNTPLFNSAAAYDEILVQGFFIPTVDDLVTVSLAQNTSNATGTILLRGSTMNLLVLSGSRRAPNVV